MEVTLLEGHGWLLPRQLNQKAGELLERHVESLGIRLARNARTKEIIGDERARGVLLENGDTIPAELVVITTGVRSNSYIARLAGMDVNRGVVVDNYLRTSAPDVFAAGDIAEHRGVSYGTWGPSQFQGSIAGMNAAGGTAAFGGLPRSNMLKVLGYDMFSIGHIMSEDASYRVYEDDLNDGYYYFLVRDGHMIGAILLGDTKLSATVKHIVEDKVEVHDIINPDATMPEILDRLQETNL